MLVASPLSLQGLSYPMKIEQGFGIALRVVLFRIRKDAR